MHKKDYAIYLDKVSKQYQLHGSQKAQLSHILGLNNLFSSSKKKPVQIFTALDDVSIKVKKGQRVGLSVETVQGKQLYLNYFVEILYLRLDQLTFQDKFRR